MTKMAEKVSIILIPIPIHPSQNLHTSTSNTQAPPEPITIPFQLIQGTTRTPKSTNTPTPTGISAAKTPHSAHGSLAPPPPNSHQKRTATSSTSTGAVHGLIAPTSSDHSRASNPSSKSPSSTSTSDPTAGSSPAVMAQMTKTPYTDSST